MSDTIIAIDLRRRKSVACVNARASREHAFSNGPRKLDRWLRVQHVLFCRFVS